MTNIYNKNVLVKNGTLIGNWYEEEILREKTGEGRTIPSKHLPKRHSDFENEIYSDRPRDNTFNRILGERKNYFPSSSTNKSTYGNFNRGKNDHKLKKISIKDKIFEDFFKTYLPSSTKSKNVLPFGIFNHLNQTEQNICLNEGTSHGNKSLHYSSLNSNKLLLNSKMGDNVDKFLPNNNKQGEANVSDGIKKAYKCSSDISKLF